MPEINYKKLDSLSKQENLEVNVYLLYGQEMLYKAVLESLLDSLLDKSERLSAVEQIEGVDYNIPKAVHQVNTFPLFSKKKVVVLRDTAIFQSKKNAGKILNDMKEAFDSDNMKKASTLFCNLLDLLDISFDNAKGADKKIISNITPGEDLYWLDPTLEYCIDNDLSVSVPQNSASSLQQAIEKGFPKNNYLIITSEIIDKRKSLYKTICKKGVAIDCSVPEGARMADRKEQDKLLNEKTRQILNKSNKRIEPQAYKELTEMTGFELRTFVNNLEKLILFIGDKKSITLQDVKSVLKRTKKDPIYEFTNAITERNLEKALFYKKSLLSGSEIGHPLQLLGAIINQIRKLLSIKGFLQTEHGKAWMSGCVYESFSERVVPAIKNYDKGFIEKLNTWERASQGLKNEPGSSASKKKQGTSTDLTVAKNPGNAYPIYIMFKKSEAFTIDELVNFLELLSKTGAMLKSGYNNIIALDKVIFAICIKRP